MRAAESGIYPFEAEDYLSDLTRPNFGSDHCSGGTTRSPPPETGSGMGS